ncbi:3-hydroxyacyl-CoA dehydrogenase [Mycolicibacterium sp.]|uniref:3-hydroxyacyl-CoA dehydrogenase n=1 Tax=Mycolicibacterium sp. TaxID=2320850 RepID=UPI003D0AA6DB
MSDGPGQASKVAVIGLGSIGIAWAIVFARAGWTVTGYDVDPGMRKTAGERFAERLQRLTEAGLPVGKATTLDVANSLESALAESMWVQECVVESLPIKKQLFAQLDTHTCPDTVLASSTSMIPCSQWAADLVGRSRCLVVHPGNPPYLLPIAEVVPAPFTADHVVKSAMSILAQVDMTPVLVRGEPEGFVFNRLQGALLREAYCLVRDGVIEPRDLDRVVTGGLGRRWAIAGPFATSHLNTRGGLRRHAALMGPAYERMGLQRGQHDPWTDDLVNLVATAVESAIPLTSWEEHVLRRDAALAENERTRNNAAELFASFQ